MTLQDIIDVVANRLTTLRNQRALAISSGDLQRVVELDEEIATTEVTLGALNVTKNAGVASSL
jgi:hypothetical protein